MWATPQNFFDNLNAEFDFDIDVCATPENAKCEKFFTEEQDGLSQSWGGYLLVQPSLWTRDREMGIKSIFVL